MKTASRFGVLIVLTAATFGQAKQENPKPKQPTGTRIGPHRLGETFNEWLAIEKISLNAVCKTGAWANVLEESSVEDRSACDGLRPISETGNGDYRTGYDVDRWTFANGKLAVKQSVYSTEITTKQLGFLKEAYGAPASIDKLPQQNAFGAKWNDVLMTWHLPGATLYMKALGGPKDDLIVTFISNEHANAPVRHEPNPYLTKPD